jgi:hypothetical protein
LHEYEEKSIKEELGSWRNHGEKIQEHFGDED